MANLQEMVLLERIELSTSPLPRVRSTTELQQRFWPTIRQARAIVCKGINVKRELALCMPRGQYKRMSEDRPSNPRDERLAAKLRENLRKRKEQARQIDTRGAPPLPKTTPKS